MRGLNNKRGTAMKKKIAILIYALIVCVLIFLFVMLINKFGSLTAYNEWWLNWIGTITHIKNKAGQWFVASIIDIVITIGIIFVVSLINSTLWNRKDED